jgi:DNA-binding transcriptional MerR regulator
MSTDLQTGTSLNPSPLPMSVRAMEAKAPSAFRTISEVAVNLEVPQHVLRFWESKFQQVRPLKRGGGRRYYRPEDVDLLTSIKDLLYNQGFTIRGVQKLLKEKDRSPLARTASGVPQIPATLSTLSAPAAAPVGFSSAARREMESVLNELKTLREILRQTGV